MEGFVKIERWVIDELKGDAKTLCVYNWLSSKLWHKSTPFKMTINNKDYFVQKGDLITSYKKIKDELSMRHTVLQRSIERLTTIQVITVDVLRQEYKPGKYSNDGIRISKKTGCNKRHTGVCQTEQRFCDKTTKNTQTNVTEVLLQTSHLSKNEYKKELNIRKNHFKKEVSARDAPRADSSEDSIISNTLSESPKSDVQKKSNAHENRKKAPTTAEGGLSGTLALSGKKKPQNRHESVRTKIVKYSSEDLELGNRWLAFALEGLTNPNKAWSAEAFAEAIEKVRRRTNLNHKGMNAVFEFIVDDNFWYKNAKSPAGLLRRGRNDLLKIDTILSQMKTDAQRQYEKVQKWDFKDEDVDGLLPF